MEIRLADPEDLTRVGEITFLAYDGDGLLAADGTYGDRLRDAATRARDAEVWLAAADDGEILGTVTFVGEGSPLREIGRDGEAEFRMLAVAPAGRGQGVGAALTAHVIALARVRGFGRIVCSSQRDMHAAHRVYERAGFTRTPERDWSPVPNVHLVTFGLDL